MLDIIKFNFKRMKSKWYLILGFLFIFYFYFLILDIATLIIAEISFEEKTEFINIRGQFINISFILFFMFFNWYLYKDYQSGIWNHLISSKIKSKKIILAYILTSFIISITNLIIYFLWSIIFYRNYLNDYGVINFFINNFFKQFSLIITIFVILILIFKISPDKKELSLIFLSGILLYFTWIDYFLPLLSFSVNSKIIKIIVNLIPLINISMINSLNEYIWLAILVNYSLIVSGALIFTFRK